MRRLAGWLVCCSGAAAQATLEVQWQLPAAPLTFGDRFVVEVRRQWPLGAEAEAFDPARLAPLHLELQAVTPLAPAGELRRYTATVFASGEVVWPALGITVHHRDGRSEQVTGTPPPLVVGSSLPAVPGDVEWPDVLAAERAGRVWPWLLAVAFVLGGAWWWQRGRRAMVPGAAALEADPGARLLAALRTLAVPTDGAPAAEVQAFYQQLATWVRAHAGRHLPVPAATRTSEEVIAAARQGTAPLRACLQRCDAVKFAAARPDQAAHGAARDDALRFVEAEAHAG